ncbi:hypothetical protein [Paragemmobacter straminiformis]|uniref:Single-strand binding protein family protein n=1 Tax=Paragemmobacter straminiformis TaxID=2045119 RepID=A0A842I7Q9_9RHOB|nr:hypothetical protein [Gemmobacter straminiformis]MBC2835666.1 hypothetical protein [Gemmobacter straminiformis]
MTYFMTFRARGEVAEMLLLSGEEPRLLVDLSVEPVFDDTGKRRHTPRASFTVTDPELIRRFLAEMAVGDVFEAEGSFAQGDYLPHRTTYIDTTFTLLGYRRLSRPARTGQVAAEPALPSVEMPSVLRAASTALLH